MVQLGATTLQLAFIFCLATMLAGALHLQRGDYRFYLASKRGMIASSILVLIAILVLLQQLLVSNFAVEYVVRYSSAETPLIYKFAGLWAGMEGSLLFWAAILGVYVIIINVRNNPANRSLMPVANLVLSLIMIFFLTVILFFENPFTLLPAGMQTHVTGRGLNPLLQNPVMLIHPPMLYLGYVGFSIPFALAIAALVTRRLDAAWIRSTRRWTLMPWLFLAIGIVLGGMWAYVELGWGGYWAWDPVENASFLPWLTGTAYLHSVIIQEKKNMLKMWNVILIMLTFTLTIFGTYITRSGIISSVHAFAASDLGIWFFGFVVFIIVGCIMLLILRKDDLGSQNRMESFTSRESGFLFNNMLFLALTFAVLWGTMFPVLSEAIRGTKITVGAPYFDKITTPMGLLLLALTGVGPLLAWRKTSLGTVKRNFTIPGIFGLVVLVIGLITSSISTYASITFALAAFVFAGIILEFSRGVRARMRTASETPWTAFNSLIDRNRSRYGGYIVHFGILIMFIGFAGKAFTVEQDLTMQAGDSVEMKGYTFTMERHYFEERVNHVAKIIDLTVHRGDDLVTLLSPEKRFYTDQDNQPNSEVAIYTRPTEDLYAILGDVDFETEIAVLKIMINPLVQMVWIGSIILVLGTIVAVWPSKLDRKLEGKLA